MTRSNHIIISVLLLMAFGLSAKAQSSARFPYEGALQAYSVNGITPGAQYQFFVTANPDGSGLYDDEVTGEFDILTPTGMVPENGLAFTEIQWNNGAALNIYYLWLEASIEGCSNSIRLEIAPQPNAFDLLSENIPIEHTESCPSTASEDGFFPVLGDSYSLGYTNLAFKVKREGGNRAWSFRPALNSMPDNSDVNVLSLEVSAGTQTEILTADANGIYTVPAMYSEVIVSVSVANMAGFDQVITLTVTDQEEEYTKLKDSNPNNDAVNHTITVMPVIRGIDGV